MHLNNIVTLSKSDVPLGAVLTCRLADVPFEWGEKTNLSLNPVVSLSSSHAISRHVARLHPTLGFYPTNILNRTEVDHWLTISSGPFGCKNDISEVLCQLNHALAPTTFLTSGKLTIADLELFSALYKCKEWQEKLTSPSCPAHVQRWYNHIKSKVGYILTSLPKDVASSLCADEPSEVSSTTRRDEGKFVELPDAEMGKVVVRFPPEASGYLHIGHAKAALLNQYYQKAFKGKLIMRFDDTNPEKEKADFEKVILEDLKLLNIEPDVFTHTSDLFEKMLTMCEDLLARGLAFVDDTDAETMKKEREERRESRHRNNTPEVNLAMWQEMKRGSAAGQRCCVRAKIDMASANGCMRDPTIYRCKTEPHVRTGDRFKVYPTYDFACPIVDSVEGVTHALRTTEYHDRDEQYFWFIEKLNLRPLHIYEYSRLNMNNTVLSKRKLAWLVNEGLVDGWDDPRFPTVRGILRRGMTVEGLKDFIVAQGSSRSVVNMEWDKIWAFNKKVIDREAPRYTALEGDLVPVTVRGVAEEVKEAQKHPKDPSKGTKPIWLGPKVFIEAADAAELKEGENATFINWGNLKVLSVRRFKSGQVESVEVEPNLANTDFKKTLKLTWLCETRNAPWTPVVCSYFDHLISKSVLAKDEDFKQFINPTTRSDVRMVGDDTLKTLKAGDIIQLQRKGFFRVDEPYRPFSPSSCTEGPVVLFFIPDGHTKEPAHSAVSSKRTAGSKTQIEAKATRKKEEKSPMDESKPLLAAQGNTTVFEINRKVKEQGDKIRKLKSDKVDKSVIMPEVEVLKGLKAEFKNCTGVEWTPNIDMNQFSSKTASAPVAEQPPTASNDPLQLHKKIQQQGDRVRALKAEKADKDTVKKAVDALLALKKDFKEKTSVDWKPDLDINSVLKISAPNGSSSSGLEQKGDASSLDLSNRIKQQGDKVRSLKASQASKENIKAEVDILLKLKKDFQAATGTEWKPDIDLSGVKQPGKGSGPQPQESAGGGTGPAFEIHDKIKLQGDKVRNLKAAKAPKDEVKAEVDKLLELKAMFKDATGIDWKPDMELPPAPRQAPIRASPPKSSGRTAMDIHNKIKEQGDKVRSLKAQKADKEAITAQVDVLLALKKDFKNVTNLDWKPDLDPATLSSSKPDVVAESRPSPSRPSPQRSKAVDREAKRVKTEAKVEETGAKKQTRLCVEVRKEDNLSDWYSQVITKGEMIEYYNVSGCYILRPWSFSIWERIKDFFDTEIKAMGIENAYFPIFVARDALEKEKTHIADFSPEVAWVTRSGSSEMAEPVAIRPTSETVMYPAFAKWIQSHRDLPLRINQWNNVVRWEFKQPTPFLRTREFLWQEGHSAFATQPEAVEEVYAILELYARVYEELLAVPVVRGRKTEKEKFAGGDFTTTTEVYIKASGRGIQGATSHHLGQNFSKMFDIVFDDPKTKEKEYAYQNSWGLTTRTIGVMVMVHGDNKGLVLPPRVAPVQVVIMPVGTTSALAEEQKEALFNYCSEVERDLTQKGIRARCDFRDNVTPAWKFNHWELKGVPLRVEVGPRELNAKQVHAVRRDTGEKQSLERIFIERRIYGILETIHNDMIARARQDLDTHKMMVQKWPEFVEELDRGNILVAPFCGIEECEDTIKKDSARDEPSEPGAPSMGAKSLCIPFEQPSSVEGLKCIHPKCSRTPKFFAMFGRSY